MPQPVGDFTHSLGGRKNWPGTSAVDAQGAVASTDTAYCIAGRAAHLNSSGQFEAGVKGFQMPVFLTKSPSSFDVATDAHNSFGGSAIPRGNLAGLVAIGGFELETTEFDGSTNYAPNAPLKAPDRAQTADAAQCGKLYQTKGWTGGGGGALTPYTDTICGVASFGSSFVGKPAAAYANYTGPYFVNLLAFWPVFIPGTA